MTPEQMRIVIAEGLGWKSITIDESMFGFPLLVGLHPTLNLQHAIPNYPTDLNACHEMEKVLSVIEEPGYYRNLKKICCEVGCNTNLCADTISATALQRCEAGIKTKWPEKWID